MKSVIFLTIGLLFACQINAQDNSKKRNGKTKIGQMKADGKSIFLTGPNMLVEKWIPGLNLAIDDLKRENFQNFMIIKNEYGVYQLQASNADGTVKSAIPLVLIKGYFYEKLVRKGDTKYYGLSVTCSKCEDGCDPVIDKNDNGTCSNGCKECEKSETIKTGSFFGK